MIAKRPFGTGHLRVNYLKDLENTSYSLKAHAELPNYDFPYNIKSFMQFCLEYPSLRNSEIYIAYAGNLTLDEDFGENTMKKLCKGGCGKIVKYRDWCKIKWKSRNKFCPSCPKLEERRAKSISLYRLQEAKLGLNPMQNPEICKKNHTEERNRKTSLTLKKLGKMGLLPQQIEPKYLRERRLRKIRKVLRNLAVQKLLPQQIESPELKARRIQRTRETMLKLAKQGKLKLQNMTEEERKQFGRRMSISLKKAVAEGRVKPNLGGFKTPYQRLNGESIILRSKWEAEVAKLLDKLNVSWQYEPFYIKYFNTEKKLMSNTLPDFYLPEQNLIIEVKGASITLSKTKDKIRWLHKQGYNVILIGRKEIKLIRRNEIDLLTKKIFRESEKLCQKLN
ncbi:MAG: hypothetical protein AABX33_08735 [Nanoarchaeota archaeon]